MLQIVDIPTGEATDLCKLIGFNGSYPSLTFSRQNGLYASRSGNALDRIDPCTCQISPLGFASVEMTRTGPRFEL